MYCQKCGSPNEYTLKKPTFCGHCGNSFQSVLSHKQPILKENLIESEEDFLEDEVLRVPNIEKLEYIFEDENPPKESLSNFIKKPNAKKAKAKRKKTE